MKEDFISELKKGVFAVTGQSLTPVNGFVREQKFDRKYVPRGYEMENISNITDVKELTKMENNVLTDMGKANADGRYTDANTCLDNLKAIRQRIIEVMEADTFGNIKAMLDSFNKLSFEFIDKWVNESPKEGYRNLTDTKKGKVTYTLKLVKSVSLAKS